MAPSEPVSKVKNASWVSSGRRQLGLYFAFAWAFTWVCWIPRALHGEIVRPGGGAQVTYMLGLMGPMFAAFAVTALESGTKGIAGLLRRIFRWRIGAGWFAISIASPIGVYLVAALAMRFLRGNWPRWSELGYYGGLPEVGVAGVWLMATLINGFGEEIGWRGFALPHLRRDYGLVQSGLLLTIPWAIWHIPAFFFVNTYVQMGAAVLPGFLLGMACGSIVFAWLYEKTGGSILAVALWHGSFNLVSATTGARGFPAAFISTVVMIWAIWIAATTGWRSRSSAAGS